MQDWPVRTAALVAVLVVSGCESDGDGGNDTGPTYVGTVIEPAADMAIAAIAEVTAKGYDSAYVRFWTGAEPAEQTPSYAFGSDTTIRLPVLGLDTATTYTIETVLVDSEGAAVSADSGSFTSGSLPAWIPVIGVIGSASQPGYVALSLPDGPVIVDNAGKVVWYKYFPNGVLNSFQAHPSGQYTVLGTGPTETEFHVLNILGEEVGTLTCIGRPTRFHELLIAADGDVWILCDETRTMDLSALGGVADAQVMATVVQHLSPTGQVLFEWNAFDHFAMTDLPAADRADPNVNFTHGNGIGIEPDGNLLLGFRSLSEITKVNSTTGDVIWRLGGLANEFTIVNDPKGGFERQHGVRRAGPGVIQVLDNGLAAPSRFVRYLVNEQTKTALMEWSFIDAPATHTPVGGSTQYYSNGHGLVSFGRAGRVIEVDATGNRVWELTGLDGMYVFRVQRIASLYTAGRGDATR